MVETENLTWAQILKTLESKKPYLASQLKSKARPAVVETGKLEIQLPETGLKTPQELAKELQAELEIIYGMPWDVTAIGEGSTGRPVAETFVETKNREQKEAVVAAADHPVVRKALDAFPGAEIAAVENEEE